MKEAISIVDDMAHNLQVGIVRSVAFFLIKVFKSIFSRIYVNKEGIQMVSPSSLTSMLMRKVYKW